MINEIANLVEHYKDNINSIITYNYDDLVETALKNKRIRCYPVSGGSNPQANSIPVYHVHGLLPKENKQNSVFPVLSEESYHALYKDSFDWSTVETLHALMRSTCILIGISMTDPNLRRLLEFAVSYGDGSPRHYVFLKKIKIDATSNSEDITYKENELQIRQERIMYRLGLQVIWIDDYQELPTILTKLRD